MHLSTVFIEIISTLLGAAIFGLGKAILDRLPYQTISRSRFQALAGVWEGVSRPQDGHAGLPQEVPITFHLRPGWWRTVRGESHFTSPIKERGDIVNDYKGGFYQHKYLTLTYRKRDRCVTGFGMAILELGGDGCTLEGRLLGYGSHIDQLFFAKLTLHKIR